MNQSNYFEEALKMRNLLEEFNVSASDKRVGIVGFREHIYTGGLSSIANMMALQEGCFVTQGQRVLDNPLRVRFHYGHPDCFDKLFFMSRGGVSKASKGINLSEDIFAGFNSVLRGGSVKFREYIQCGKGRDVGLQQLFKFEAKLAQGNAMQSISRDVYRLANTFDFFRLCSFFFGGVGFYLTNTLTIWALYLFIYTRLILAGFRLESLDSFSGADTISYWFGMIGFLLTIPVFATIGLERGFRKGFLDVLRMIVSGATLYYLFQIGTKHHFLEQTMLAGGAKYRPTGRGFVTRHEDFAEIFRFHAASHFYRSVEMMIALLLYVIVIPPTYSYSLVTWAGWLLVIAWLFGPFWFNPLAFEWEKTLLDFDNFSAWMSRREGDGDRCWKSWWKDETSFIDTLESSARVMLVILQGRYLIVATALIYFVGADRQQVAIAGAILAVFLLVVIFLRAQISLSHQFAIRLIKAGLAVCMLIALLYLAEFGQITSYQYFQYTLSLIALTYVFHALCNMLLVCGFRFKWLRSWFKLVDCVIAGVIFLLLGLLSLTVVPGVIQTRLMFHNAFSRGVLIDKLLKTKPDDGATGGGSGSNQPSAPTRPDSGTTTRRRKDARSKSDSPDEDSPEHVASAPLGFDFDAISFIERRSGVTRKKLHPSKQESLSDSPTSAAPPDADSAASSSSSSSSSSGLKKARNVSFARKAPSITNLDDLLEDTEDYSPSPTELTPQLPPRNTFANATPTTAATLPPYARSAGSTPTGIGGGAPLPSYGPIAVARTIPISAMRSTSDQLAGSTSISSPISFSAAQSHASSSGRVSPSRHSPGSSSPASGSAPSSSPALAPSSPHLGASAPATRTSDKLLGRLPDQAMQDERPIPQTILSPRSATIMPPVPAATNSPLNPRRA